MLRIKLKKEKERGNSWRNAITRRMLAREDFLLRFDKRKAEWDWNAVVEWTIAESSPASSDTLSAVRI